MCPYLVDLHSTVQHSQHHLPKRPSFLHSIFLPPLSRLLDHWYMGLFWGSLFCSIDLYVCFMKRPYCFDYCSFVVLSEVWEGYTSCSVVHQDCFGNSGSLWFHVNLRIICSSSGENVMSNLIESSLNL